MYLLFLPDINLATPLIDTPHLSSNPPFYFISFYTPLIKPADAANYFAFLLKNTMTNRTCAEYVFDHAYQ
jgi:hypothetical protein